MRRYPLRSVLFLLALAGILPLAGLAAAGLYALFSGQKATAQARSLETARALATAVDAQLERSFAALEVLATATSLEGDDLPAFDAAARRALAAQADWQIVSLADVTGRQLVNTFFANGERLPATQIEPESFRRVVATGKPTVGVMVAGRKGYGVPVRVPVRRGDDVRLVLTAVVDPGAIVRIVQRQNVPADWVISVFDSRGLRVARSRGHENFIATSATPSLRALMASGTQGTGMTMTLEGDEALSAFSRLPRSGWTVAIGMPPSTVNQAALQSVLLLGGAVLLSILIGMAAAGLVARQVSRPMARLRDAATILGRGGEPESPASRVREVHEVGTALAQAGRSRARSEAEREELLQREHAARNEAEAANRAKDEFLAMLGHELRNPLAALSSAAAVVKARPGDEKVTGRAHEVIHRQVKHLARLTDDLLDAARALLGKIELRKAPHDLARIAANAIHALQSTGRAKSHTIEARLEEAWVVGDEVRLDQIATNLLVNAVKYTPAGRTIRVRTAREGRDSVLVVEDDGMGLSPELAARVFEPFVQGERSLDRSQGGLGIGLTLVQRLARLHDGTVTAASEGENRGSRFTVRLPAVERTASADAVRDMAAMPPRRILVVEDNEDARESLRAMLELMGHRVIAAADGAEGLERALADPPDVGLVDLGMPGIDGFEFARRLRASGDRATRLYALTGYGSDEDRARARAAGFDGHFTKPLDVAAFMEALGREAAAARRDPATA